MTKMWDEGDGRVLFRSRVQERGGVVAIANAAIDLR